MRLSLRLSLAKSLMIVCLQSGLKVGDMILAINTETFIGINYDEAVAIIKSLGGKVKMLVTSPREEEANKVAGVTSSSEARPPLQPRRESEVKPAPVASVASAGSSQAAPDKAATKTPKKEPLPVEKEKPKEEETKVELTKDSSGVGFSVVGGSDTPLVSFKSS